MKRANFFLWASLVTAVALPVAAQNSTAGEELEEVLVTAEFREVDLQKTAINLTVLSSDDLIERGVVDTRTMLDSIPGLDMTNANPNNYIGLYGTASAGGSQWSDGSMGFVYGGIPLARQTAQAAAMYDLESVTVLKGPQGTLYGRNATTGSINMNIARPRADFAGKADITVGNYGTINTQGSLNLPYSDRVQTRFAFQTSRHDGYFTNGYDDANNMGFRASVLFKASDNFSVLLWGDTFRNRSRGPSTTWRYYFGNNQEWIDPSNPWFGLGPSGSCANPKLCPSFARAAIGGVNGQAAPTGVNIASGAGVGDGFLDTAANGEAAFSVFGNDARSHSGQDIYATELNWNTGAGTLTAIVARANTLVDYDTYTNGLRFGNHSDVYQNSLELRFANTAAGRVKWLVGAFAFQEHQNAFQYNMQNTGYALLVTPNLTDDNYAAFGDATFVATDRIRVSAGLRYTREQKRQDGYVTQTGVPLANFTSYAAIGIACFQSNIAAKVNFNGYLMPSNFCTIPNGGNNVETNTSGKLGFEWDLGGSSMVYVTAKQGFRSGGFTAGTETTYKPEHLNAYELGSRSRFLDGRMQLNVSAFKWDYKDQQLSSLQPYRVNGVFPAGVQTAYPFNVNGDLFGVEADFQMRVASNDRFNITLLYAKGKFDSTPPLVNSAGVTGPLLDIDRYNLPTTTLNAGYVHGVPLRNGAKLNLGIDAHYESDAWMQLVDPALRRPGMYRKAFTKWNADFSYHAPNSKWSVTAFVRNASNEAVPGVGSSGQVANGTFFKSLDNPADARSATLDPPRTVGLRISADF
jgi:iron complex outermembrane receptor protein